MPGISGQELIQPVRSLKAAGASRTVVVTCSGDAPPADMSEDTHDAYLVKPLQTGMPVRALAEHGVVTR